MKLQQRLEKLEQAQTAEASKVIQIIRLAPGEQLPPGHVPIAYVQPGYLDLLRPDVTYIREVRC